MSMFAAPLVRQAEAVTSQLVKNLENFDNETVISVDDINAINALTRYASVYHPLHRPLEELNRMEERLAATAKQIKEVAAPFNFKEKMDEIEKLLDVNDQNLAAISDAINNKIIPSQLSALLKFPN